MTTEPLASRDLREYARVVRRQAKLVAVATAVVVATAVGVSLIQAPVYQATGQVLLQQVNSDSVFSPDTGQRNDPTRFVQTEIQVLSSQPVRDAVRAELGSAPKVVGAPIGQTDVIQVAVRNTDAKAAAALANAYARRYIDLRRTQTVNAMLAASQQVQAKIDDLQKQIDAFGAQIDAAPVAERAAVQATVGTQRDALVTQQATFKSRLDQLSVEAALSTGNAELVTPASVPTSPVKPKPLRNGVLALAVGLLFGVGLAFLFDRLDDSLKSAHDLERVVGSLPTLGLIPAVTGRPQGEPYTVTLSEPSSPASEAYRSLRTSIRLLRLDQPLTAIQVTSPALGEGKSTTVANLAVTMAQVGLRTVIVCCDLRRPRIHEFFGLSNTVGFTSVLLGDAMLAQAVQAVPDQENLFLLASGPPPANPSELLSGGRVGETLDTLRAVYDLVLIDCPPVLPVTDAAVLSTRVDGTLLVAYAGSTNARALRRSIAILDQVGAPLVGVVLNGAGGESGYGYGYGGEFGYGYGYGAYDSYSEQPAKPSKSVRRATPVKRATTANGAAPSGDGPNSPQKKRGEVPGPSSAAGNGAATAETVDGGTAGRGGADARKTRR